MYRCEITVLLFLESGDQKKVQVTGSSKHKTEPESGSDAAIKIEKATGSGEAAKVEGSGSDTHATKVDKTGSGKSDQISTSQEGNSTSTQICVSVQSIEHIIFRETSQTGQTSYCTRRYTQEIN